MVGGTFAASVYGGYFGAGLGVMLLAILGLALPDSILRTSGLRTALSILVNGVAAAVFLIHGGLAWEAVGLLAAGSLVGGWIGARIALSIPATALRIVVVAGGPGHRGETPGLISLCRRSAALLDGQRVVADHGQSKRAPVRAEGLGGLVVVARHEHDRGAGRALAQRAVVDRGDDGHHRVAAEGGVVGQQDHRLPVRWDLHGAGDHALGVELVRGSGAPPAAPVCAGRGAAAAPPGCSPPRR